VCIIWEFSDPSNVRVIMAKEHFCNDQECMVDRSRRREYVELKLSRQSKSRVSESSQGRGSVGSVGSGERRSAVVCTEYT